MNRLVKLMKELSEENSSTGLDETVQNSGVGKRKLDKEDILMTIEERNEEEDDLLVIGVDQGEALDLDDEGVDLMPPPSRFTKLVKSKKTCIERSVTEIQGDEMEGQEETDEGIEEHRKLMRTIALGRDGQLTCTVSNENDESESVSGRTESVMADTIRGMLNIYQKRRDDVLDRGIVATPLHVVKKLAKEHGETLHFEIAAFPKGGYRVELFTGAMEGVGEGVTKSIAAQMAAVDVLEKVQLAGSTVRIPPVAFLPGMLTTNRVFTDLFALCKAKELPRVKIVVTPVTNDTGKVTAKLPPWRAECWVGKDLVTVGESENELLARREAAREMYLLISNMEYKDSPYAIGEACRGDQELASSGYRPIVSDQKKKWLQKYRTLGNIITGDDSDLFGVEEHVDDDFGSTEDLPLDQMKNYKIKISVSNNTSSTENQSSSDSSSGSTGITRCVSVKDKGSDNSEDAGAWYFA